MHMAAAMGTPVVALFGPSGEAEWGPWRVPHRVVASTSHSCRPCGNNGCGGSNHSDCLLTLPEARVAAAVAELLAETDRFAAPMRLGIVRQRYTPFGGAERFVERAIDALRRARRAVRVYTRKWPQDRDGHASSR